MFLFLVLLCIAALIFFSNPIQAHNLATAKSGMIKGRIIDKDVKSPIVDARVKILGTSFAALTDHEGRFSIPEVPVGSYILEITCRFYAKFVRPDVIVKSKRITFITAELVLDIYMEKHEEITVRAGYFAATEKQPASVVNFSNEEIRRTAGSAGDVSRSISGLPSVARVNDQVNTLIVRGGSPAENAFYIDNIAIPNINHYPAQGSTGGALALLNVDFISDVNFYSGGFSSVYGNRLSSVMDISFREGNRDEHDLQLDFNMTGFGLIAEGPLAKQRGAWMFSGRRSYLDLLADKFNVGVPPNYSDIQGKLNYDISSKSELAFLGLMGFDKSGWGREYALELGDSNYGYHDAINNTFGLNWFLMWGAAGYSNTSISRTFTKYGISFFDTTSTDLLVKNNSSEQAFTLRNVNHYKFNDAHKIDFGLEIRHFSLDYDYSLGVQYDVLGNLLPPFNREIHESAIAYAAFVNHTSRPLANLTFNLGLRLDYFSFNKHLNLSPRLSFSYQIAPKTSINGAAGIFTQTIPSVLLLQNNENRYLKEPRAYHYVLGIHHLLTPSTKLILEVYHKEYQHMPLDPSQAPLFLMDELTYSGYYSYHDGILDAGKARTSGVEFLIQKKLAEKIYGLVSTSYFHAMYRDVDGHWRNRVYDNRYILSIEGGYKPNRNWEFSLKWHYAGGVPYTPFDIEASRAVNCGIFDSSLINGSRLPAYHSLNLRVDKRFYFRGSNLTIYFSVWNVYNRQNVAYQFWNTLENRPDQEHQWSLLPILGVEFEF